MTRTELAKLVVEAKNDNMIVIAETRDGEFYVVDREGDVRIHPYEEDLRYWKYKDSDIDIVKIYQPMYINNATTVWERKEDETAKKLKELETKQQYFADEIEKIRKGMKQHTAREQSIITLTGFDN